MSTIASDPQIAFERALAAEPRSRVVIERVRAVFEAVFRPAAEYEDPRRRLADALRAAAAGGTIRLPTAKRLWERERDPPLPKWVERLRPATAQAPTAPAPIWHPLIAAAVERTRPDARLIEELRALDEWLKGAAREAPLLPIQERSYEIFGEEKRLGVLLEQKFCRAGGLTAEDLRCYRVTEPFAMNPFDPGSDFAIAVENLPTYDSLSRAVAAAPALAHRPAAVIFGRGKQFIRTCESLPERLPLVRRLNYFGDLDEEGLAIALLVQKALAPRVPVTPWDAGYSAMFAVLRPPAAGDDVSRTRAAALARFFTDEILRSRTIELLVGGHRIPQEAATRKKLEEIVATLHG